MESLSYSSKTLAKEIWGWWSPMESIHLPVLLNASCLCNARLLFWMESRPALTSHSHTCVKPTRQAFLCAMGTAASRARRTKTEPSGNNIVLNTGRRLKLEHICSAWVSNVKLTESRQLCEVKHWWDGRRDGLSTEPNFSRRNRRRYPFPSGAAVNDTRRNYERPVALCYLLPKKEHEAIGKTGTDFKKTHTYCFPSSLRSGPNPSEMTCLISILSGTEPQTWLDIRTFIIRCRARQ